ncbi:hypothetical protein H4R18_000464 [Coemansia javaensis]|uniref:BTB domain-containing protein n=1 Tax=Coemansia javaensis TaxID=2761396 RepID=A0A9W8LLN7_9FUNG|nr:hypothetical protein H4R18_000464 [Coemansia javaensis]
MPGAEHDLTELFVRSFKCTGDVPPALVGSSVTYLRGHAYVFGGRALHSARLSNDIYACDLQTYQWRRIGAGDERPGTAGARPPGAAPPPPPRFFHSATAFRQYLVVFGGMGLDVDPDAPAGALGDPHSTNIQDDRNQQSFQVRTSKTLLDDIAVFDTQSECWVSRRALDGAPDDDDDDGASAPVRPAARYAHLSALLGHRLLVVGGQDLEEQYVEELNVFDLRAGRWVHRSPFPRAVGLYRSFIASPPAAGGSLLYSNFSFASVKRSLYQLSAPPDCTLKDISAQMDGEPAGLRFPRGHVADPHTVVMSGTLISSEGHSEMSLWALDSRTMRWQPIPCGARFRTGSWNQSVVDPRTNTLVVFGDSRRDLAYDYQRRRLNYTEVRAVDLRALGYMRAPRTPELPAPIAASPLAAARTAATGTLVSQPGSPAARQGATKATPELLGFEIGAQLLHFTQFNDAEILAADGSCVAEVNTGLLRARWPKQTEAWLAAAAAASPSTRPPSRDSHTDGDPRRPASPAASSRTSARAAALAAECPRRMVVDAPREAIFLLVFFLYTGVIDPAARFGLHQGAELAARDDPSAAKDELDAARVLGELLVLAARYSLDTLAERTAEMLHWRATGLSAPLIFEAALRADHQGLQARCVIVARDHIPGLRADRQSPLYMISSTARASILRFFPKPDAPDAPDARQSAAYDRSHHQHYPTGTPRPIHQSDSRQRAPSDALMAADHPAAASVRSAALASPSPPGGSPSSTLRGAQARSPYPQHDLGTPRRPWEAAMMSSPVINSPASSRYSTQSPEVRGGSSAADYTSSKRLSGFSHLANQPLPEDIAVNYAHTTASAPVSSSSDTPAAAPPSRSSKRTSRYLGGISAAATSSVESIPIERRTSDSSSMNEASAQAPQQHQQPQQHQHPVQQQPQQQQSSRSLIFRPWNKMKKIASSSQVSTDSLPPVPAHSSTFSGTGTR